MSARRPASFHPITGKLPRGTLLLSNRQRTRCVDLSLFRRIAKYLLSEDLCSANYDLGVYLVSTPEMTRLNETFVRHSGTTDVIAFDYSENAGQGFDLSGRPGCPHIAALHGEVFVSVDEAVIQSRRFRSSWQAEMVRYLIHGLLHLLGYDDVVPARRRKMKREESRLMRKIAARFPLSRLGRKTKLPT